MTAPYTIIDGFLPLEQARAMREGIDAHFGRPEAHQSATHQVWNYWHVPGLYTYLRTAPERVIGREGIDGFYAALSAWASARGLAQVTWPYLSLYVPGCRQGLHNDAGNGDFAFVYSLTKDDRRTIGGGTIVLHEMEHFREKTTSANAGSGIYDTIEPKFNRLIVFDDRLIHGVERVDGSMNPVEGRFVLHGHLS